MLFRSVEVLGGVVIDLKTTAPNVELFLVDHDCINEHDDIGAVLEQVLATPVSFNSTLTNEEFTKSIGDIKESYASN